MTPIREPSVRIAQVGRPAASIALLISAWLMTRDRSEPDFDGLVQELWVFLASGAVDETNRASAMASVGIIFGTNRLANP
jgi:hypothetical protein